MTTNIQSFAGDVQIDSGNLSVKSLEVKDGVTKLGSNNTSYSNVGVMMTRKDGASNVAFLFTEDGSNVVLGYTNDDALEDDRIDILTDEKANLVVYGNVYVSGSVHGDGSTLTGLVTTLQSVSEFGAETDQTILFTNEITGINVSSNVLVSGNVTANVYYGDGGLLANITQTLEGITAIGNTTPYTLEFNNTDTAFVTVSNVGIGNALPTADLCVGSNVVIDDASLDKISVTGNVNCHQLNLGSIEILPAYSLEQVTGIGNTTTNTMSFNHSTLAFDTLKMAGIGIIPSSADVGVSGLHVDGHLRLGGEADNTDNELMYIKSAGALGVLANESDTNNTNTDLRLQSGETYNSNITMVGKSSAQYMTFGTNTAERMRIDSSGNVGIGTTNPDCALSVTGSRNTASPGAGIHMGMAGTNLTQYAMFQMNATDRTEIDFSTPDTDVNGRITYDNVTNSMRFLTNGVDNRLFINSDGNVGVGTANPVANLHVLGNVYVSSNLSVSGNVGINTSTTRNILHLNTSEPYVDGVSVQGGNDVQMIMGNRWSGVSSGTIQVFSEVSSSQPTTDSSKYTLELNPLGGGVLIGNAAVLAVTSTSNVWFGANGSNLAVDTQTGRVGIGLTNPEAPLHIEKVTAFTGPPKGHATTEFIRLIGDRIVGQTYGISAGMKLGGDTGGTATADGRLEFYLNDGAAEANDYGDIPDRMVMTLRGDGNLGIGTTAPQYKLDLTNATTGLDTPMNPAMDNDIILFDDGRSTTTFNGYVGGNATRDTTNQQIRLTPDAVGQTGWVNWNLQLPNSWTCEFEMYRGSTGGADQIWFIFYGDVTSTGDPTNASNYYYFVFDEYLQDEIILGRRISGTSETLLNVNTTYLSSAWQKVVVNYERGRVSASVDGVTLIDYQFNDASIQYTGRQVAFRANCGSIGTDHYVRKIKITKGNKWIYSNVDSTSNISYMNGNVGVGTANPTTKLHVHTDDSSGAQLYLNNDNTGGRGGISIAGANGEGFNVQKVGINGSNVAVIENFSRYDSGISFYTKGDGEYIFRTTDSNSKRFSITNDGNVGVGGITPQSKFHVDGDVRMKTLSTTSIGKITPVYARGAGQNNNANRLVKIGDTTHVNSVGRGLTLTIINASTHAHESSTDYDTYGSTTDSDNLATALEAMTDTQIGIITSYDAYEDAMTANLINACYKLGLTRLAASNDDLNRHPYAAIFYGPGASTVPGNHALEVMKSDDASGAYATLSTFLIDDSFIGQTLTNALYSGTGDSTAPTVIVDRNANVGIGTTNPLDKLMVMNGTIRSHDSGNTTNNPGLKIRRRPAAAGQSGSNYIECGQFTDVGNDSSGTDGNKFIVKNDGNVGIGTSNPTFKFDVVGGTARIRTTLTGGGFIELGGTETNPDTRTENVLYGATTYINLAGSTARYGRNVRFQPGQMYGGAMWATSGYGEPTLYGADNVIYGGDINAGGNDGTGAGQYYAGNTYIGAGIAWAGNTVANSARTYNGSIYFQTGTDDTTSSTDTNRYTRMTIDRNGNVGIGIAAASDAPLHIYRNGFNPMVRLQNGSYNQYLKPVYNEFRIESAGDIGRYGNITFYTGRTNNTVQQSAYVGTGDSPHGPGLYGNSVVSTGIMIDSAFDFILGTGDQSSRGDTGISRALVKNSGEVLNINYADDFEGGVYIQGSVSKDSGSFKIDHPLPEMADTHHLVHSFIEGPQADNLYRGVAQLEEGVAVVNIDEASRMTEGTFVALNRRTQCFTTNETDWDQVRGTLNGNILTIECQNTASTANVSWLVIGERQDKHMYETRWTDEEGRVITEPEKPFSVDENEFDHWIPKDPEAEEMNMEMEMARKEVIWPDMEDAVAEEN